MCNFAAAKMKFMKALMLKYKMERWMEELFAKFTKYACK